MTENLIQAHGTIKELMPYLHLPIQSGSNKMLEAMNRKHDAQMYLDIIDDLRKIRPDIAFSSDFIVGFPGETDLDFEESLQFVEQIGFSQLHVFRYSPRRGTRAVEYPDQVPPHISAERSAAMIELGADLGTRFKCRMLGKRMDVLVEDSREGEMGQLAGFTPNYLRVLLDVPESGINQITSAKLTALQNGQLQGEVGEGALR